MGMREYNAGLDEMERGAQAGDGLTRSLSVVADTNPDEEARQEVLSRRTGIPAAWMPEFKDDAARRSLLGSPVVQDLPRTAPKTTQWLSDRNNARLAHDDIETLAGIEGIVDMMGRGTPDLAGAPTALGRGLKAAPARLSTGLAEMGDILFTPFLREGARLTGSELLRDLSRAPRIATDYWRKEAGRIAGSNKPGSPAAYAGQIGESVGSSVLSMPFGIAGQGPALAMFGLGSEGDYRKYTDAGYNETYAALLALSTKAMEGITEKMGLDVLYNPEKIAKPVFRTALEFLVGELGGEELNTLWGAAKDKLNLQPDMTIEDLAVQVVDTAIVTFGASGAQGVGAHLAARAADRLEGNVVANRNRALMATLGATAANSKLLKRLPDKAREFVEYLTADGPVTNVYIPVEEWTTYFQSRGMDPAEAAASVLGDGVQYQEASATGSDLVIPLGRYVQTLAGTEHHAGLSQDMRLRQGDMTAREEGTFRENLSTRMAELVDQGMAVEADQTPQGAPQGTDQKVYDDVLAQLTAAGRAPEVAAREATLWQVRYRTRAQRLGVDPYDLYRERSVKIMGAEKPGQYEFPDINGSSEGIRKSPQWKALAEDLIEKKYKGKKFDAGDPLIDRLGKMGRLQANGAALRGLNAWENGLIPFFTTKATGRKGKSLKWDVALRSLVEEGYLPEGAGLDDLVGAIQRDQEAKKKGGVRLTPGGVTDYEIEREAARRGYFQSVDRPGEKEHYVGYGQGTKTTPQVEETNDVPSGQIDSESVSENRPAADGVQREEAASAGPPSVDDRQLDLFGKTALPTDPPAAVDQIKGNFAVQVELQDTSTLKISVRKVTTPADVALALSAFSSHSQENFLSLVLDAEDRPLAVLRISLGTSSATLVAPALSIGGALSVPGAVKVFFVHNHPSGDARSSSEDVAVAKAMGNLTEGSGLKLVSNVILGSEGSWSAISPTGEETSGKATAKKGKAAPLSVQERVLRRRDALPPPIDNIQSATGYLDGLSGIGVLLLNTKRQPLGYVALTGEEMGRLRGDSTAPLSRLLRSIHESNANAAIIRFQSDDPGPNRSRLNLGNALRAADIKVLDAISTGGLSMLNEGRDLSTGTTFFQEGGKDKRGYVRFGPAGEVEIGLLEKANLSTFLHETGHAWFEELRADASREDAPEQIKADWKLIAENFGVLDLAPGAPLPTESHESFARSVEAFFMEGKAPSAELASTFQRFKAWLVQVYREITRLGVNLTPEVRGVLDRLVATDEEISAAEARMQRTPIFATAEAAGMTQTEFEALRTDAEKASVAARETIERDLIVEFTREKTALWKQDRERVEALVEEASKQNPVFQVYHLLIHGELLDGSAPATPIKLSRSAFVDAYGQEFVDRLPPKWFRKMTAKDGMHPDLVAEMFGFASGAEMIRQLQEAPTRQEWIHQETDRRMKEVYGDLLNDGTIAEAAIDAVHNDETGKVLRAELRAIRRKDLATRAAVDQGQRRSDAQNRDLRREMEASIPPIAAFREAARKTIDGKSVMSLHPEIYLRAEQKSGKKAFDAAAKDNWEKAGAEKKKQILNHYLYMEARKAQGEVDVVYRYVQSLIATTGQERIGKAGGDYLAQINGLLEQYEFRQATNKAIEERRSLIEWAQEQERQGLEPDIPPVILYNARQINYRELKIDQLLDLRDALKNIEHLARQQGRLLGAQAQVSFNEAASGLIVALHENVGPGKKSPIDRETRSIIEREGDRLTRFHVALLKTEQFVEWADGKDIGGAWNTYIFQPIADAQALEGDITMRTTKQLAELFDAYAKESGGYKALKEKIFIESLGESLTRQAIVAAALNTGNEGNLDKMLGGRGWSEDQLNEVLSHLTRRDWQFVQQVWDAIEGMWPDIAALQKRMTGLEPKKVSARQFTMTLPDGESVTLSGGYYPAVYDSEKSAAGAKQVDATGDRLFEGAYVRAATEKGHTKERTTYRGPILLSLEVIPQHFATVIHDLTHREAIVQAWRLLQNQAVRDTITETMGAPYYRMLNLWLASVATDRQAPPTGTEALNRFIDRLRMNATIVAMGFKFTTVIAQAMDIGQSFRRVKGRYLAKAFARFVGNPAEARRFVQGKSGEMRHRERNLDRDLRDLGRQLLGKKGILPEVQKAAMRGITIVDMVAAVPTWLGAYEQALSSGMPEADAIHWADRTVRLSNPAGGAKDLAAVQRKESFWKLFTMFYSYFNVMYNAQADEAMQIRLKELGKSSRDPLAGKKYGGGDFAIGALSMWVIPALAGELLAARGPDDDEEWWQWMLRKLAVFPFLSLPGIRDIANAVESGREYQMTPVAGVFTATARMGTRAIKAAEGEREPEDLLLPAVDLLGYSVGLPTGQAKITGRYAWDLMEGETPESAGEFMRNMMFYRKRK